MPKTERYYSQQYSLVDNPAEQDHDHDSESGTELRTYPDYDQARQFAYESDGQSLHKPVRRTFWSRRNILILAAVTLAVIIAIAIAAGVTVGVKHKDSKSSGSSGSSGDSEKPKVFEWKPSNVTVQGDFAFTLGGATQRNVNETNDGIGPGLDSYTFYKGNYTQFPSPKLWVSFEDMWKANMQTMLTSCENNKHGENNTPEIIQQIYDAIQNISTVSYVDHRFILAIILQESHGCVRVKATDNGVRNPGLMQSHDGHEYDPNNSFLSILAMVQDGTQGTDGSQGRKSGDGLAQALTYYSSPYAAARAYNSGKVPTDGELSTALGATACYVSDVANRLMGWVYAASTCQEDS